MLEGDPERFASSLNGKRVIIGITASISIYRVPDIIRDLRREGAEVIAGMSREAAEMISPEVFRWATGNEVVTGVTGNIEHVELFRDRARDTMLLVCPASYNFIGKAASGISDDVPSLFFSFALGNGNPVVISPVMHEGMLRNPVNNSNLQRLEDSGVSIVPPRIESERAKISDSDKINDYVSRSFHGTKLKGKSILIIGGRGEESIDPVRKLTNSGTGFTASWFVRNAFRLGVERISFVGNSSREIPDYAEHLPAFTFNEFREATEKLLRQKEYDAIINVASLPDFTLEEKFNEKISSSSPVELHLKPLEKLNGVIRKMHKGVLVVFKLENQLDFEETTRSFGETNPEIIVFNSYNGEKTPFGNVANHYTLVKGEEKVDAGNLTKQDMTVRVLDEVSRLVR